MLFLPRLRGGSRGRPVDPPGPAVMPLARRVAAIGLVALLAGCSLFGGGDKENKLACPTTQIAPDLDALTVLRPGGTGTGDIRFGVKLIKADSDCEADKAGGIRTDTRMSFIIARNDPDLTEGEFTYFVAIADSQRAILAKEDFTLKVQFAPRQNQMRVRDDISEHLPVRKLSSGKNYSIVVGFQLTPEQLELNRKRSGE
jgi:hypothetical protein